MMIIVIRAIVEFYLGPQNLMTDPIHHVEKMEWRYCHTDIEQLKYNKLVPFTIQYTFKIQILLFFWYFSNIDLV
jgi:hypothetical protein